ncbi:hypothetical protein MKW94_003602 [Papaver nudicaule]|uniref:Uncharacterized protein n=1 Tax=Papaver nudicaule TaxID=74823 RepID=A0AA42ATI9_PAPNU|nr:hypothetical protein [Papaver nudicaule]MCL7045131.1 hypothetical protein [Papaver nudicaule]
MAMMMAWKKQLVSSNQTLLRFFSKSLHPQYAEKVGIPEFLNGIGKGVETHVDKIEAEIGDFHKLPVTPNRNITHPYRAVHSWSKSARTNFEHNKGGISET